MTKNKIICPRCFGNGYIRIPNKAVGFNEEVIAQCTMMILMTGCSELLLLSSGAGVAVSHNVYAKAYNSADILTIMHTDKGIKQHAYEKLKNKND